MGKTNPKSDTQKLDNKPNAWTGSFSEYPMLLISTSKIITKLIKKMK